MKRFFPLTLVALGALSLFGCEETPPSSDRIQQHTQEKLLAEGTAQTGMPAIHNFRERKLLKEILELRDQASLSTWTYLYAENTGKRVFLCNSIGYGIPYATEYTSPQKIEVGNYAGGSWYRDTLPQADPNGLFSPPSAEGTWVMCKDPNGPDVKPVYIEPRIIVSPFPFEDDSKVTELPAVKVKP